MNVCISLNVNVIFGFIYCASLAENVFIKLVVFSKICSLFARPAGHVIISLLFNPQTEGRRTVCVCPASKALIRNVNNPRQWAVNHGSVGSRVVSKMEQRAFFADKASATNVQLPGNIRTFLMTKTKKENAHETTEKNYNRQILFRTEL